MTTMLRVTGLGKEFEGGDAGGVVRAVRDVTFEIAEGEFFALLGPSGCGKTTTLRCVAGLERPDAGSITIGNRSVADASADVFVPAFARNIGMVFQSYAIWPHLDVFENVAYPLRVKRPRMARAEIVETVTATLTLVGLEALARRSSSALSGGQQQRVALARALVAKPRLLLLDEPLSNLDAKLRDQMQEELADLVRRVGITTLYVTHDQAEALAMADRIAVMSHGSIVQQGRPREVYERPRTRFVASFLGQAGVLVGTVASREPGGHDVVSLGADAGRVRVSLPAGLAEGSLVDLLVRPEAIALEAEDPGHGEAVAGEVARIAYQGHRTECYVRVAGTTVRVLRAAADGIQPGDRVWLRIDPDRCLVCAHEGEADA